MKNHKNQGHQNLNSHDQKEKSCNPKDKSCQPSHEKTSPSSSGKNNSTSYDQSKKEATKSNTYNQNKMGSGQASEEYKHSSKNAQSKENRMCRNTENDHDCNCKPKY